MKNNSHLDCKFIFLLLFFFIVGNSLFGQDYKKIYKKLDNALLLHKSQIVIQSIDSLVINKLFDERILNEFFALKIEALTQSTFLPEALELSNRLLQKSNLISEKEEVRVRIQRALIFEYFEDAEKVRGEFNRLEKIYNSRPKDEYYGCFLFRKSSYYRVLKPTVKSDSLARYFAEKAAKFGDENKYFKVSGTAKMLQGFMSHDLDLSIKFLKEAVFDFKALKNNADVCMTYYNLSNYYTKKQQDVIASSYLDSALVLAEKYNYLILKDLVYEKKYKVFETEKQLDSALHYYKKYHVAKLAFNLQKQNIEVSKINFENKINKQNLEIAKSEEELFKAKRNITILIFFLIGIFTLALIIYFLYKRLRQKNKEIFIRNKNLNKTVEEKKLLLKELNHRVKNNLSLIISLIKFQGKEINDDFNKEKFKQLENRILTIAIAHEQFIYSENDVEGKFYNLEEYLLKISDAQIHLSTRKINCKQEIKNLQINIDTALPIGILINELISNSIQHAIIDDVLEIEFSVKFKDKKILITYFDSGTIFKLKENNNSLGLIIIDSMIKQLEGSFVRNNSLYTIELKHKN